MIRQRCVGSPPWLRKRNSRASWPRARSRPSLSAVPSHGRIQVRTAVGNVRMPFRISGSTLYQSVARLYKTAIIASDRARRMPVRDRCFAERVGSAESIDLAPPAAMYRRPPEEGLRCFQGISCHADEEAAGAVFGCYTAVLGPAKDGWSVF